jgi:hypothetical protein
MIRICRIVAILTLLLACLLTTFAQTAHRPINDAADIAFKTVINGPVNLRNVQASEKWHSSRVGDFFK